VEDIMRGWKTLDVRKTLDRAKKQLEATTSANVGGFAVPLGSVLRPPVDDLKKRKKKDRL
jgi:hypothetical protein